MSVPMHSLNKASNSSSRVCLVFNNRSKYHTGKRFISPLSVRVEDTMLALQGVKTRPSFGVKGLRVKLDEPSLLSEECSNERSVIINSGVRVESS